MIRVNNKLISSITLNTNTTKRFSEREIKEIKELAAFYRRMNGNLQGHELAIFLGFKINGLRRPKSPFLRSHYLLYNESYKWAVCSCGKAEQLNVTLIQAKRGHRLHKRQCSPIRYASKAEKNEKARRSFPSLWKQHKDKACRIG